MDNLVAKHNPLEDVENFLINKLNENSPKLLSYFEDNKDEILNDFLAHFIPLCEKTSWQQEVGIKAPIACVHIGFLRSSLLTKSYEFRIGLHDEKFWMDNEDSSVYWKADFFFQYVEPDIDEVRKILKPYPHLPEAEVYEVGYRYAQCYLIPVTQKIMQNIMIEVFQRANFGKLNVDKNLSIVFGGYMEEGESI